MSNSHETFVEENRRFFGGGYRSKNQFLGRDLGAPTKKGFQDLSAQKLILPGERRIKLSTSGEPYERKKPWPRHIV